MNVSLKDHTLATEHGAIRGGGEVAGLPSSGKRTSARERASLVLAYLGLTFSQRAATRQTVTADARRTVVCEAPVIIRGCISVAPMH